MIITGSALFTLGQTPDTGSRGSMWYNKYTVCPSLQYSYKTNTWSLGGIMNVPRFNLAGGGGLQNAAIAFGGYIDNYPTQYGPQTCTEKYDGTSFSTAAGLNTAGCSLQAAGLQNSALAAGGEYRGTADLTEKYNGTSWSNAANMNTGHSFGAGTGLQNAALVVGDGSSNVCTEKYDGTSWTTVSRPNLMFSQFGASGTQNSSLAFGGYFSGYRSYTEKYNGTSWSTVASMNVARMGLAGVGTQNDAAAIGGLGFSPPPYVYALTCTEEYNGTSWNVGGSLLIAADFGGANGAGTRNSGLSMGNVNTPYAQEYNLPTAPYCVCTLSPTPQSPTYPTSQCPPPQLTWSLGGNLNTGRGYLAASGNGSQNATSVFGGIVGTSVSCTEKYNGTSWSTAAAMNYRRLGLGGAGQQNTALAIGGYDDTGGTSCACTEKYDGTSWSNASGLIDGGDSIEGAGFQNAALAINGYGYDVEKYNGVTWSTASSISSKRMRLAAVGLSCNNVLAFGGYCGGFQPYTEYYNGSSWSSCANMNVGRSALSGAGNPYSALAIGGYTVIGSSAVTLSCTEFYNGISWYTNGSLIYATDVGSGAGGGLSALSIGGYSIGGTNRTQEFN